MMAHDQIAEEVERVERVERAERAERADEVGIVGRDLQARRRILGRRVPRMLGDDDVL
jgi:hypothetical protein